MMMMNEDTWSHHPEEDDDQQKYTSWSIHEESRKQLIQRATTRLRRRLLEEKLQDIMRQLIHCQAQLETIRVDTSATMTSITNMPEDASEEGVQRMNRQMDVLEKRLESHKFDLDQFFQPTSATVTVSSETSEDMNESSSSPFTALSMSRLSSLSIMPSIFGGSSRASTRATSVSSESFTESKQKAQIVYQHVHQQKKEKRRKRVKHHKRRYQESVISASLTAAHMDDTFSEQEDQNDWHRRRVLCTADEDDYDEEDEQDPFYDLAGKRSFRAGSFCGSVYCDGQEPRTPLPSQGGNMAALAWRRRQRRKEFLHRMTDDALSSVSSNLSSLRLSNTPEQRHPLVPSGNYYEYYPETERSFDSQDRHSPDIWTLQSRYMSTRLYPERNVLDEAMSFLDCVEQTGDDNGFREDLYLLLRNPDLCRRPFSEIESTMHELRQQEQQRQKRSSLIRPVHSMMYKATLSTLQWCRFLSVLSAAVVISLLKGPEDLLHNPPISR
ncbi:hypothetical protein RMATCC62417_01742 [Rhizopus microsporus]|nr:hypothetical protein RMATCC62417_01742 [Rhizopus microsporus]